MAVVEAIVSVVIDKFTVFVTDEAQVFAGQEDKLDSIFRDFQFILSYLRYVAEDKSQTRHVVQRMIKDVAYEAEDILDTLISRTARRKKQITIKRYTFIFNDWFARLKFLKEIKRIHTDIRQCVIPLERFNHRERLPLPFRYQSRIRETEYFVAKRYICGLEDDLKKLESRLVEGGSDRRVISIVGMGGLGKTTLAKLVYNSEVVARHFDCRAWIFVSQEYRVIQLLNVACESILGNVDVDNLTIEQKIGRLSEYLKDKRYLIVLDDVWDVEGWGFLREVLLEPRNGSRVLLTTRQNSIASVVDPTSPPHEMKFLSPESSWMLFEMVSNTRGTDVPPELIEIGKQIVMKCGGLPLAIKVIAGLLHSRNTVEEWSTVLRDFSWDQLDIEDSFFKILELSYKDLPFFLQPLFLYFLVFPKEHEIPVRRLFGLWHSEGIVTLEKTVSWEDLAHNYLAELIDRNMIQVVKWKLDGKPKTCQIAGIVRDLFLSNARDIGIFHIHQNNNSRNLVDRPSYGVRRLVEYTDINDFSSLKPHIRKSRSYISFNFRNGDVPAEVTGRFLGSVIKKGGFGLLRILDLERVYKPELPQSLGKLYLLKYLGLRWTFLDALPSSVEDLSFLETLDVKHTYVSHLPTSIWKLKHLQHLYLNEIHLHMSSSSSTGHHIASFGKNLQTLLGLSIDMETPVKDILYSLITFKKLGLTCQGTMDEAFVKWISKLTALETLRLRSRDGYGRPSGLKVGSFSRHSHLSNLYLVGWLSSPLSALELPQNLTVLTLSVSRLELDPMPILEQLPKLRALRLLAHSYIGNNMVCSDKGFPSLCILKLWMLEELREWSVEKGAMANLEELEIRCCKRLNRVPQELLQLTSLRALVLTNMPGALIDEVEAEKENYTSLSVNTLEFPTFADQVTSPEGESSQIVPNISA